MTSVFVTGANGYIGLQVAIAFRNAGYRVYGLVRSQEKGAALVRNEIIPVVGELTDLKSYQEVLDKSWIIVDNVLDFNAKPDPFAGNKILLEAAAKSAPSSSSSQKVFIYTSGVLAHPRNEDGKFYDETQQPVVEVPLMQTRLELEQQVLSHTVLRGIVLRPGFVYGGSHIGFGNHLPRYFENGKAEKIVLNNTYKEQRWPWVHVVDLADAYVRAAKRSHLIRGEAINVISASHPTVEEVTLSAAKVAGFKGTVEYNDEPLTDWLQILTNKTVLLTNKKAKDLLDWTPNHIGPLEELEIYYHTTKGSW